MADGVGAQRIRKVYVTEDDLKLDSEEIKAQGKLTKDKSKRYSRRKTDGNSRTIAKSDFRPGDNDEDKIARPKLLKDPKNGGSQKVTCNRSGKCEPSKTDYCEEIPDHLDKNERTDSHLGDRKGFLGNPAAAIKAKSALNDKENPKKERKTRKGFEPYQIKRGKFSERIDPSEIEALPDTKGTKKDEKDRKEQPKQQKNKSGAQKISPKRITGVQEKEVKNILKSDSPKGRNLDKGKQRATMDRRKGDRSKQSVEGENWDLSASSLDASADNHSQLSAGTERINKDKIIGHIDEPSFEKKTGTDEFEHSESTNEDAEHKLSMTKVDEPVKPSSTPENILKSGDINNVCVQNGLHEIENKHKPEIEKKQKQLNFEKKTNDLFEKYETETQTAAFDDKVLNSPKKSEEKKIYQAPSYNKKNKRVERQEKQNKVASEKHKNLKEKINVEESIDSNHRHSVKSNIESLNKNTDHRGKDWDLEVSKDENISSDNDKVKKEVYRKKSVSKTVAFLDQPEIHDESQKKLCPNASKSKRAGIIVLPSSDVLKNNVTKKIESEEESSQKKLYNAGEARTIRSDGFPERTARKDGSINHSPIVPKEDYGRSIRISSSGDEVWNEIQLGLKSLKRLLSSDFNCLENIDKTLELSAVLQDLFKELIVKHQDISFKNDVEGCLWKNTFHNMISKFRSYLEDDANCPQINEISQYYWNVLQDGDDFLEELLNSIQEEHNFDVSVFAANALQMNGCKKQVKLAVRSCHLILLNLGDLERYIADLKIDNNYSKANDKYQKAQSLAPKNGKSYNQLAVVAVKCKKKLDALYYYVRSLEASNPIESARERLTGIFQDIKRKAEQTKCRAAAGEIASFADAVKMRESKEKEDNSAYMMDYSREDVWVFYRSGRYYKVKLGANGKIQELGSHTADKKQKDDSRTTSKVSLRELNKEFLIYYLYMHSKLYTRIGFEYIMTVYQDTLRPLKLLTQHEKACSMKRSNLVKYMAINIFSVNNLFNKQDHRMEISRDSPIDTAIIFGMDMCGELAAHCANLLQNPTEANEKILDQFLPAVRIWMKWMCVSMDLIRLSSACHMKDIWQNMVLFFNATRSMKAKMVEECEGGEPTALFEDIFLAGFQPLVDMEQPSMKVSKDMQERAQQYMRSESLKDMTFMISESHKLPIVFSEDSSSFEVVAPKILLESPAKNGSTIIVDEDATELENDESDVIIEDVLEDSDEETRHFRELMAKKTQLTAKLQEQEKREKERAAIVESNASQVHMISENHPKFIVPDTNCFIDNLDGLRKIIDSKDFTVILPLIVVNELDGLKKGAIANKKYASEAHAFHLKERARLAIELLESRFAEGESQLKALTSVGTELDTIAFRDEELSRDQGKNDDIILSCCLHYCEEAMNRYCSNEGPLIVQRKVVLLTDDRNLRLKAHSRHVPTISLSIFMKMATL